MIKLLPKRRTPSTILGLTFDGSRLEGVVLRRSNGTLHVQKTFFAALALNPLNADPELMGREIRNHLEQAGIRERRCVVGIPLNLVLTLQLKLPELPEEDIASFLAIEAERGFPYGPEALSMATSRYKTPGGEQHATLVAIPKSHLQQLEAALRSAQLRPVGFTLGITALQAAEKESSRGVLALAVGENTVDLQLTCEGGVAMLRSLEGAIETEGVQKRLYGDVVAREIRVTLGQQPGEIRSTVRKVRLFGNGELAQRFTQEIAPRMQAMGLQLELVKTYAADEFRSKPPPETPVSSALSIAARHLTGVASSFEFLPPKVSPFQLLTARFSSRKLAWIGSTAGAAAILIGGAILVQQWQLSRLRSEWTGMEKQVHELEDMQQQIRRFRPWFDESFQGLSILQRVTEAFPVDGVVSAKTVEIRELSTVTCSGVALDNQAFLKMLDQLRASKEVGEVKVDQVRGKTPLQFTLNFQWGKGGASAN